jgi:hypothetical protein
MILPQDLAPAMLAFATAFSEPTWVRFQLLMASAVLTTGRRTVANLLRTLGPLAGGHPAAYRRVFSSAAWSGVRLACTLTRLILTLLPQGTVRLVADDTVDGHQGKNVWGKGRHRDPVRSTHSHTAWRYGHRWVVLTVLVRFPWAGRDWALPVLADLYLCPEQSRQQRRPHRTPAQRVCRLVRLLLLRFPEQRFLLVADGGYGTHEVARFAHRHEPRLHLVSKLHPDANLYEPPPPYNGRGRPRVKGDRLPRPREAVAEAASREPLCVDWYGGGTRRVEVITGTGHWYRSGRGLVALRWVHVRDKSGTHRDEYLFTTDPSLSPEQIVGHYTSRWHVETTFQEMRSHLGLETTRGWCRRTVQRLAPCLFGLYSVVALLYHGLPEEERGAVLARPGKAGVAFSDAITRVRRWLWRRWVFRQAPGGEQLEKLPAPLQELLFSAMAPIH